MFINKNFIIFLPFLYFNLALSFYKNIQTISNKNSLYTSIIPDISETNPYSDILLPYLTPQDKIVLDSGEMIKKQERNGSKGLGLVVLDIKCSPDIVFDTLTQFSMYQDIIPIVRSSKIVSIDNINTVVEFKLSKRTIDKKQFKKRYVVALRVAKEAGLFELKFQKKTYSVAINELTISG